MVSVTVARLALLSRKRAGTYREVLLRGLMVMKPDVRLYDVLPAVFRGCLWALCADLRFADARSDVAHPHVSLRLYSLLSPHCFSADTLLCIDTVTLSKSTAKGTRKGQN